MVEEIDKLKTKRLEMVYMIGQTEACITLFSCRYNSDYKLTQKRITQSDVNINKTKR